MGIDRRQASLCTKILQTLRRLSPMAFRSGGGGENFHTEDSPDLGVGVVWRKGGGD